MHQEKGVDSIFFKIQFCILHMVDANCSRALHRFAKSNRRKNVRGNRWQTLRTRAERVAPPVTERAAPEVAPTAHAKRFVLQYSTVLSTLTLTTRHVACRLL